jgi:hypothetical protein
MDPDEEFLLWTPCDDGSSASTQRKEGIVAHTMSTSRQIVSIAEILGSVIRSL